jgi:LuxR family transcriptional regulator, maltose regulon positive regulatory protein
MNADAVDAAVSTRISTYRAAPEGLAKFTMPSVPGSYPRRRLFAHLDRVGTKCLVWVSAPAGYGKTTVVSNYLRARSKPTIWYQCDEGDADVASFYYYLNLARRQFAMPENLALPSFQPEHLNAIPTFTRNFFRAFFAGLPRGAVLVFDNWQDIGPEAASTNMLPVIAEQIPDRAKLIVISRMDPGANLVRLRANEAMSLIVWDRLRLSRSEAGAIAKLRAGSRQPPTRAHVDKIFAATEGWPAAFTLLLSQAHGCDASMSGRLQGTSQAVFDYLAAEVFDRLDPSMQHFLLATCWFEHFSIAVAKQVSGREDAGKTLDALTRQNAFTMYRPASNTYYYHPLFRAFLRGRLDECVTAAEQNQSLVVAGYALSADGDCEGAIGLLLQAQACSDAALMIHSAAESLVRHSRFKTLLGWLDCLPSETLSGDGWLKYWRGVCELSTSFLSARSSLETAYRLFVASKDCLGQMLACSAMLRYVTYSYADYRPMIPWIEALESLLVDSPSFPAVHVELQVQSSYMLALSQALPEHPQLHASVERVSQLVDSTDNLSDQASGISALLHFFCRFGRTAQYGELDAKIARVLGDPALKPVDRLHLLWLHAYQLHHAGDTQRVLAILAEARALARHEGLTFEDTRMRICELQAQEAEHRPADAVEAFCELEPWVRSLPPMAVAHFLYVRAIFEMASGHLPTALKYAEEAVPIMRSTHWKIGEALCLTGLGEIYCALRQFSNASRCVDDCRTIMAGTDAPLVDFNTRLLQTEIARNTCDDQEFTQELSGALRIGREQGYANGFHTSSQLLRTLIPHALRLGVEGTYCRWVIARRGFKPPSCSFENWPWPVRVRAMGNLEISVRDAPLKFARKTQRKPLDLLKVLTSSLSGIEAARLMDWLWPDLDGDAARNALDLALHRLRRMLQHKESVIWKDSHLQLNPDVVWTDTGALERMTYESCATDQLGATVEQLLALYRAPLLCSERDLPPVIAARDRMRDRFVRIVSGLAERLAATARWGLFSSLCLRALEIEPLEERLHRAFIRGLLHQGHTDQARFALENFEQLSARSPGKVPKGALESQP